MSEAKYTPGPWHWNGIATIWNTRGHGEVDREVIVAQVVTDYGDGTHVEPIPVREANARLVAAAPELLEACRELASEWRRPDPLHEGFDHIVQLAEAAIAKAEGRDP